MGVTIKDVAEKCGLSITTVSLVLNNKDSRISEKTKQLITETAHELSYIPNRMAVGLATKRTLTVGLVTFNTKSHSFSTLMQAAETACHNAGYMLVLNDISNRPTATVRTTMQTILSNVDGLILDSAFCQKEYNQELLEVIHDSKIPIVTLSPIAAQMLPNSIIPDWKQGISAITEYLIEQNHKRIGCVFPEPGLNISSLLLEGYRNAIDEHNLPFNENLILEEAYSWDTASRSLNALMKENVTAVISYSDIMAASLYYQAKECGIEVPRQLSLVSLEDSPFFTCFEPYISSLSLHADRAARKSLHLIQRILKEGTQPVSSPELIPPFFFQRNSVAKCP